MTHPAMPRHRREDNSPAVAPSPDPTLVEAAYACAGRVLPSGYHPHRITEPPAVVLVEAAEALGVLALAADVAQHPDATPALRDRVAALISGESRRLAGVLRSIAAGAAAVALLAVGLVLAPTSTGSAQAMEGPEPDPVAAAARAAVTAQAAPLAPSYRVVLDRSSRTIRVAATTYTTNAAGLHCARVQLVAPGLSVGFGILARACSRSPWFTIPVPVTAGRFGAGGTYRLAVVDDLADAVTGSATLTVLRPSRIAGSYVADGLGGQLFAAVALEHYSAAARTWMASKYSPIRVQVMVGRTWRTIATLTTDGNGYAGGYVWTGPGRFLVRLVRPQGGTVTGVTGAAWGVTVTATSADVA